MSTEFTPASPERGRTRDGWADRARISETRRDHLVHLFVGGVLAVCLIAAEAILLTTVANILVASDQWKSWSLVLGVCTAIVTTAVMAGNQIRHARATGATIHRVFAVALLGAWFTLGMMLMIVRWRSGALQSTDVTFSDSTDVGQSGDTSSHVWLALMLLGLHVVIGMLAVLDGYRFTNPVAAELRRLDARLAALEPEFVGAESDYVRATKLLDIAEKEEQLIDEDLAVAREHADAVFDELRDAVRLHIAELLGDPAATGGARRRPPAHNEPMTLDLKWSR